jgi:hypothetical protein
MSVSSEVQRTLVKSPPELWAELSDPATLARHLGELGEIRILRTEPERTVDWEAAADGAQISGKIEIEPSGWGTKVTLSASRPAPEPEASDPEPDPEPEPEPEPEIIEPGPRPGLFARLFRRRKPEPEPEPDPSPEEERAVSIAIELAELEEEMATQDTALLTAVLDRLGAAHHRPFSRA